MDWFHRRAIVVQILEDTIVCLRIETSRQFVEIRVDIPLGSRVFATLKTRAKLPLWLQEVDVVRPHKVLRHAHNSTVQTALAVMVTADLGYGPAELCDLDFIRETSLERRKQNLTKAGLQSVHQIWNRPVTVILREVNHLAPDEVLIRYLRLVCVKIEFAIICLQPGLPIVRPLLVEHHINGIATLLSAACETHNLLLGEILLELLACRSAESLVIFHLPSLRVVRATPRVPFTIVVKRQLLRSLARLENGRIHKPHKPGNV